MCRIIIINGVTDALVLAVCVLTKIDLHVAIYLEEGLKFLYNLIYFHK